MLNQLTYFFHEVKQGKYFINTIKTKHFKHKKIIGRKYREVKKGKYNIETKHFKHKKKNN